MVLNIASKEYQTIIQEMKEGKEVVETPWGKAKIDNHGYYAIVSTKEGNFQKLLHRLIFEDYHDCKLDKNDCIHHIDNDTWNNHPTNLICMSRKGHQILHLRGKPISEEHKVKISESLIGRTLSDEHRVQLSKSKNTSGYLNVIKDKNKKLTQGFFWRYTYTKDGKRKSISSVDIEKLEQKVKAKGLPWEKFNDN